MNEQQAELFDREMPRCPAATLPRCPACGWSPPKKEYVLGAYRAWYEWVDFFEVAAHDGLVRCPNCGARVQLDEDEVEG